MFMPHESHTVFGLMPHAYLVLTRVLDTMCPWQLYYSATRPQPVRVRDCAAVYWAFLPSRAM